MMCELCSIKDFIIHWVLPLLCLFELRNFETIQYVLCHCKFSYMINQKFMKLCTLQDPDMKMCTISRISQSIEFLPLLCFFGLRNFETIHHALCHKSPTCLRPKKNMCVYCHMSKNYRVGWSGFFYFILLTAKPEIVVPESDSGISFFEISGKMTNYAVFLPSLLSILTRSYM